MVDNVIAITAGSGTSVRTVTNAGVDSGAHQQVVALADSAGNLLGTTAAPVPTAPQGPLPAGTNTLGNVGAASINLSGTITVNGGTVDGTTDLSGYSSVRLFIGGTFVATIQYEVSNDGTNWATRYLANTGILGLFSSTTGTGTTAYGDIGGRYFRIRTSAYTSGTVTVNLLYTTAASSGQMMSLAAGGQTIGSIASIGTSVTPGTAATNLGKAQGSAAGTTDTGVATLAIRAPATPAARTGTAGNYELLLADQEGKLIVQQYADPSNTWRAVATQTTTTAGAVRAAAAAGIRNYVTGVTVSNSSATGTLVTILDGATVMWETWLAAGASVTAPFETPLQGTAATAVNVNLSVAVTSVYCAMQGYLGV